MNAVGANQGDWDKHFKLMTDIDLSSYTGTEFNIIGALDNAFTGVFNGNSHTISNFNYISSDTGNSRWGPPATDTGDIGLFGYVDDPNAEIRDLGLIGPNIITKMGVDVGLLIGHLGDGTVAGCYIKNGNIWGYSRTGGLVGYNRGVIIDCYSSGSVTGSPSIGGLVGYNNGTITDCYSSTIVSGTENIGGLVGCDWGGTITNCSSSGSVSGTGGYVGGLVGDNNYDTITSCYSSANVSGKMNVGGLLGDNEGTVSDCYSVGSVTGTNAIGGLVGFHWGGLGSTITNCYSASSVLGTMDSGGLVGLNFGQRSGVMNSFWDIQTSEQSTSAGGTGKTTEEMQLESIFTDAGWDFAGESTNGTEDIWTFSEGTNYPRLGWAVEPVTKVSYGGGTGTQDNPYLIYTAEQLNMIGLLPSDWGRHFKLMADIDLSGFSGTYFNIIGYIRSMPDDNQPFCGVFEGNGKTISNFSYYSETEQSHIGLFAYVDGENALIKNLGLIDPNIDVGASWKSGTASSLAAVNSGTISNCYVQGGSVSGAWTVGGLVGDNYSGTITNCYSATNVSGDVDVGGLVGYLWDGTIINCYSSAGVSGNIQSITGTFFYVGGLVGYNSLGKISTSFWDVESSGQTSSAGGTGKTTAEMQMKSTFIDAGWDFVDETANGTEDIWWIDEGNDYPRLWWELITNESLYE